MHRAQSGQRAAPQVRPVIAELLRTCTHPNALILRIEHIVRKHIDDSSDSESGSRKGYVIKLFLTDGDLLIQALLHRKLSTLPEIADLRTGDIVEIQNFMLKRGRRKSGKGHIVYLGIDNCYVIKSQIPSDGDKLENFVQTENTRQKRDAKMGTESEVRQRQDEMEGGFVREGAEGIPKDNPFEPKEQHDIAILTPVSTSPMRATLPEFKSKQPETHGMSSVETEGRVNSIGSHLSKKRKLVLFDQSDPEDDDVFETMEVDLGVAKKRRQALHQLSQNIRSSPSRLTTKDSTLTVSDEQSLKVDSNTGHRHSVRFAQFEDEKGSHQMQPRPLSSYVSEERITSIEGKTPVGRDGETHGLAIPCDGTSSRPTTPNIGHDSPRWGHFHQLLSLYSPSLPSKSYTFTALVIPTYVASHLISRPNSAFPPKRHIKVVDPSLISKYKLERTHVLGRGITVSVYRNASTFKPVVGRVALMRGVVMQRLSSAMKKGSSKDVSEVILNVYPENSRIQKQSQSHGQDRPQSRNQSQLDTSASNHNIPADAAVAGQIHGPRTSDVSERVSEVGIDLEWFIDDHELLRRQGYAVDAVQKWWNRMMVVK